MASGETHAGHGGAAAAAAWASMARRELWQEPHWSPMPQRCRSRMDDAPALMAFSTSRSDLPRQMQMITMPFPSVLFETESQYTHDAAFIPFPSMAGRHRSG